ATVRVAIGKLSDVIREPEEAVRSDLTGMGFGTEPTICEVIVAPEAISADDGAVSEETRKASVLRFFFDKKGNTLFRTAGSLMLRVGGKLKARITGDVDVGGSGNLQAAFDGTGRISVKSGLDITGGVVRINGGKAPVARVGSTVTMTVVAPIPITVVVAGVPSPGTILTGAVFT